MLAAAAIFQMHPGLRIARVVCSLSVVRQWLRVQGAPVGASFGAPLAALSRGVSEMMRVAKGMRPMSPSFATSAPCPAAKPLSSDAFEISSVLPVMSSFAMSAIAMSAAQTSDRKALSLA